MEAKWAPAEEAPYHYGTLKLSDEPISEPHSWITRLATESEIDISVLEAGEIMQI